MEYPHFNRKYIFKGFIFHCYVSLPKGISVAPPWNSPFLNSSQKGLILSQAFVVEALVMGSGITGWVSHFFGGERVHNVTFRTSQKTQHYWFDSCHCHAFFPHKWYCCMCVWHCHQETFLPLNLGLGALWMSWQCWDLWSVSCRATAWSVDKDSQTFKNP